MGDGPNQFMPKKTKDEIAAEIAALEACKTYAPHYTKFGDNNHAKIDRQIEFLKGDIDMTAPEWDEFSEGDQSAILEAECWAEGQSVDGSPSSGWDSYKPKKPAKAKK